MFHSPKLVVKRTEPSELVKNFTKFYCDLILSLYNVNCAEFLTDVRHALKDIRRLKFDINQRHENDFYVDINYEQPAVRCAYLYAYSVLNTAIVHSEFLKHIKENEMIPPNFFSRKTLKICCLAGGPGNEAVAVCKAVSDFISTSSSEADLFTDVQVTIVDIISEWNFEGEALINALNNSSNLFNWKTTRFHYTFLKADLLSPFEKKLKEKISEADIVTVVKFGSEIEEKSKSVCISFLENMIQNVIDCMDEDSCLFMLDTAGGKIFKRTMQVVSNRRNNYRLELSSYKKYRLLPKTLQKIQSCINFRNVSEAATIFPTLLTTISSCFWIKSEIKP